MRITWENGDWPGSRIENTVTDLAWLPQGLYHGLLGVGCDTGTVGITVTDLYPTEDDHSRYNFNLRGHHSTISMVTWNKTQTKLASCDSSGMIYVWTRNDDRWSVELVNDRGVKVRDLTWSPDGQNALICYEDNFVLIGSANGQRIWSQSYPATTAVMCGVWAPDSDHLVLGFASGEIRVVTDQGNPITERTFLETEKIVRMAFSTEHSSNWTLAMLTDRHKVLMIKRYDDVDPMSYQSPNGIVKMRWNHSGTLLAIITEKRELIFLDREAKCVHREVMTNLPGEKPLTAITWAFGGQSIIVAAGGTLIAGRLLKGVPSLFNTVCYDLWKMMGHTSKHVDKLPIPQKEKAVLRSLDHHIIRSRIPKIDDLCDYVCSVNESRCYCTIRPLRTGSHSYVLCMEHLGGLVPLLIGRQVNRFLPQFHISIHPQSPMVNHPPTGSSAQVEDISITPRTSNGRNSLWRRSKRQIRALMSRHVRSARQDTRLLQVSSNIWCTRFNISSMNTQCLPSFLGQVVYKTSVLHLQPRQMTIELAVLSSSQGGEDKRRPSVCPTPSSSEDTIDEVSLLIATKQSEDGLTREERAFFDKVVSECTSLRAAITTTGMDSVTPSVGTSQVSALKDNQSPVRKVESRQGDTDLSVSTTSTWQDEIESLEFIDGDDRDLLMPGTSKSAEEKSRPLPESCTHHYIQPAMICRLVENERLMIQKDLDGVAKIAGQLSKRCNYNKRDRASINKMRQQMKELLKRVNEIEKKVTTDDVRVEVRQLMRTLKEIKAALGEGPGGKKSSDVLTMHNKTPFWNETNQVYQLDFGGRVTQESAKNFQVELENKQVLQFGRIDGGAYTLDFRAPFSASQAFAVALASITQRLK